ncbi:hypothetical protein HNY73_003301 [Argiope bruennichi]|uniref:Putative treble-clef zinc-finger domain-containing protein n=1 Tax=Argiope bruennichi TaxID=94029 RepID=A0A8T0FXM8_ARGBR|nr:hypothetical protein HNY73_003301 [Argiope bruennichi]
MNDKSKNLFEDLGKPTLRGVRKCPKCGTYNGTRGLSCKNKDCKLVFKMGKEKRKPEPEVDAVKIVSGSPLQIYSVKLGDINEDSRCFVHLPLIEGIEALQDEAEVTIIKRSAATCYAVSCMKPVEDTGTLHLNLNPCSHTHSVVNCVTEAEPLILKKNALKSLPISEIVKQQICSLVSKPEEHLVQRITKNTMVTKCIPDDLHPLGYLHFSIFEPGKNARKFKILCGCQPQMTKPFAPREKQLCLHFYMCVCAFASNSKLMEEFKPVVQSVPLEVTRSFIENRDGTYVPYQPLKDDEEAQSYRKTMNNFLIKPLELKTFLKVGNLTQDQKEPTPFIVEWIPDILPKTQIGELRIKFQYGHERNGILEHRNTTQNGTRTESQDMQPKEGNNAV